MNIQNNLPPPSFPERACNCTLSFSTLGKRAHKQSISLNALDRLYRSRIAQQHGTLVIFYAAIFRKILQLCLVTSVDTK